MCGVVRRVPPAAPVVPSRARARSTSGGQGKRWRLSIQQSRRGGSKTSFLAQAITKSAHGFNDVPRFPKFFAETANVSIDSAGIDHAFITPDFIEQTISLLDAAASLHQRAQKFELQTVQLARFPIHR